MDYPLPHIQVHNFFNEVEGFIFKKSKIPFEFTTKWSQQFEDEAGIYAIFDNEQLIYIGETASIRKRMGDLRRTINHTFRRKLGFELSGIKYSSKQKYTVEIENAINQYYIQNLRVVPVYLNFGRSEVESYIIRKYQDVLMNSKKRRGVS